VIDLSTVYLGLRLTSPLMASSSPLTGNLDDLVALQAAGVGAVVLPSLFEEQLKQESLAVHEMLEQGAGGFAEAPGGFMPELHDYNTGPSRYLRHVEAARTRLEIPVIASLNGDSTGGWVRYAHLLVDAGASAIELNVYRLAADPEVPGRQIEEELVQLVTDVRREVKVPIAVKLGPYYSALGHLARRLGEAGADGLVLFNRFYQPDIDLETMSVTPRLVLSTSDELRLPLRWIAMLAGRVDVSLAATTGVHTWEDVAKVLLAGADVAMMASALLIHGPDYAAAVLQALEIWLLEREYTSVAQLKGSMSQRAVADPSTFERANYLQTLMTYSSAFRH
jgi:dihydroorotate dehydrogenase (fumarate)